MFSITIFGESISFAEIGLELIMAAWYIGCFHVGLYVWGKLLNV